MNFADWTVRIIPILISLVGLGFSIAAFLRSGKTAKIHIPPPVVTSASKKWVGIVLPGDAGKRFGISEVRSKYPMMRMYETVLRDSCGDNIPSYEPIEGAGASTRILIEPPTTAIVFHHPVIIGSVVRVKVLSRGDDRLASWFTLPLF